MRKLTRALAAAGLVAILAATPASANVTGVLFTAGAEGKTTYDIETGPGAVASREVSGTVTDLKADNRCVRVRSRGKNDANITNWLNEATVCGKGKTKTWSSSYIRVKKTIQLEICTVNVNVSGFDPQDCRFAGG